VESGGRGGGVRGFLSYLLDAIIPRACLSCGRELVSFDLSVEAAAGSRGRERLREFFDASLECDLALGIPVSADVLCPWCWSRIETASSPGTLERPDRGEPAVSLVSPFFTGDELLSLVRFLKFSGGRSGVPSLGWWMAAALVDHLRAAPPERGTAPLLVPVPLHPARERSRGYNQAALLALDVGERLGLEVETRILVRTRKTRSQSTLDSGDRAANVAGAFVLARGDLASGRSIVLVDDLVTTGETALECVASLRDGAPAAVVVLSAGRRRG
jgi:ComF family protein